MDVIDGVADTEESQSSNGVPRAPLPKARGCVSRRSSILHLPFLDRRESLMVQGWQLLAVVAMSPLKFYSTNVRHGEGMLSDVHYSTGMFD